jgi:hypothetical protein
MQIFFVYSLVFLFLAGFAIFSVSILATHPDREESIPVPIHLSAPVSPEEQVMDYAIIAALFLFFLFITLQRRKQYFHSWLDTQH